MVWRSCAPPKRALQYEGFYSLQALGRAGAYTIIRMISSGTSNCSMSSPESHGEGRLVDRLYRLDLAARGIPLGFLATVIDSELTTWAASRRSVLVSRAR